jgi:tetratricopeptide (TPR) repeat protein
VCFVGLGVSPSLFCFFFVVFLFFFEYIRYSAISLSLCRLGLDNTKELQALENFEKALKIYEIQPLASGHIDVARTLMLIGIEHGVKKDYHSALTTFKKVLEIRLAYSTNDSDIADTYFQLGETYENGLHNYNDALGNYKNVLCRRESSSILSDDADVIETRQAIDRVMALLNLA